MFGGMKNKIYEQKYNPLRSSFNVDWMNPRETHLSSPTSHRTN